MFTVPKRLIVRLGTGLVTPDNFRRALYEADFLTGLIAEELLGHPNFKVRKEEVWVESVIVSGVQLGFKKSAPRRNIYLRAAELGLETLPCEGGPQLRLQYPMQPKGECIILGMSPLRDKTGVQRIFAVENGDGRYLSAVDGRIDCLWPANTLWVFRVHKQGVF